MPPKTPISFWFNRKMNGEMECKGDVCVFKPSPSVNKRNESDNNSSAGFLVDLFHEGLQEGSCEVSIVLLNGNLYNIYLC